MHNGQKKCCKLSIQEKKNHELAALILINYICKNPTGRKVNLLYCVEAEEFYPVGYSVLLEVLRKYFVFFYL